MTKLNSRVLAVALMIVCLLVSGVDADAASRRRASRSKARTGKSVSRRNDILVVDTGMCVRAMELYKGSENNVINYGKMVAGYKRALGDSVNVYCMVIPSSAAFFMPDSLKYKVNDQSKILNNLYSGLAGDVVGVNVLPVLHEHMADSLYFRTDHHWAPIAAYFAAEEFARIAQVPFVPLDGYDRCVVKDFVGSMYRFTGNKALNKAPEEFVYYMPRDIDYDVKFNEYKLNSKRKVVGVRPTVNGSFFKHFDDGSSSAYCTFMGGDTKFTKITTSVGNKRKLLIVKDSYGNALPGYLFASFQEIHVADFRYFQQKIVKYARANGITDVLFANNIVHASMRSTIETYLKKQ
ncbi:MAG: DHHW family protein [Muribaculaceae bacterium]